MRLQEGFSEYHQNVQRLLDTAAEADRLRDERATDKSQTDLDAAQQNHLLRTALGERRQRAAAAAAAAAQGDGASAAGDSVRGGGEAGRRVGAGSEASSGTISTRKQLNRCVFVCVSSCRKCM